MSLPIHNVSNPAGELDLLFVRVNHFSWADPLLYADDWRDWTVTLPNLSEVTFLATGTEAESAAADDTGMDSRAFSVPDRDGVLWHRLQALAGNTLPVTVTFYRYLSTDLTAPVEYSDDLNMSGPTRDGDTISFDAASITTSNRDAPTLKFTFANSPGLRR